jgi:hypothetical protein
MVENENGNGGLISIGKLVLDNEFDIDEDEKAMLRKASDIFVSGYPDHSLLELWNATVNNLRRRVERMSVDYFLSSSDSQVKYHKEGIDLCERWKDVKDYELIEGCYKVGIVTKKGFNILRTILQMRNDFSAAHNSDETITHADLIAFVELLSGNVFNQKFPEPVLDYQTLLKAISSPAFSDKMINNLNSSIKSYNGKMIHSVFGLAKSKISLGEEPSCSNVCHLFPTIWERANESDKTGFVKTFSDYSSGILEDKGSSERLYNALLLVGGVKYLPERDRVAIFKRLSDNLLQAKNSYYGWELEEQVAKGIAQVGYEAVPSQCFSSLYSEIIAVWCGNGWGRSDSCVILHDFVFKLPEKKMVEAALLLKTSKEANAELYLPKPRRNALELLDEISSSLSNESQKAQILSVKMFVEKMK